MRKCLLFVLMMALLVNPAWSAVVYIAGCETGDLREMISTATMGAETTVVKTGAYSFRSTATINSGGQFSDVLNSSTLYFRQYSRIAVSANPSTDTTYILNWVADTAASDIALLQVRVTSAGACSLILRNAVTSTDIGTPFSISQNTWYLIELKVVVSATVGVLELKVDGDVKATGSSLNTGTVNIDEYGQSFAAGNLNGLTGYHYLDNLFIDNAAYIGAGQIIARHAKSGTPTYDAWTKTGGATISDVWKETPYNATTYAVTPATGDPLAQTALVSSFSSTQAGHGLETIATSDTINAILTEIIAKKGTTAGARTYNIRTRLNGTDNDGARAPTTSDAIYRSSFFSDTLTNLNAAEFGGVKSGGAGGEEFYIEDGWIMVDYTPGIHGGIPVLGQMTRRKQ